MMKFVSIKNWKERRPQEKKKWNCTQVSKSSRHLPFAKVEYDPKAKEKRTKEKNEEKNIHKNTPVVYFKKWTLFFILVCYSVSIKFVDKTEKHLTHQFDGFKTSTGTF